MHPFELTCLGRSRFHQGTDAVALYFRVMRAGRYLGAYAGAVAGPDLVAFGDEPPRRFWSALAHAATNTIGVRLLAGTPPSAEAHVPTTIWVKAADLRVHLDADLPEPVQGLVFRTFTLEEDPLQEPDPTPTRILSTGASSLTLKSAAAAAEATLAPAPGVP